MQLTLILGYLPLMQRITLAVIRASPGAPSRSITVSHFFQRLMYVRAELSFESLHHLYLDQTLIG